MSNRMEEMEKEPEPATTETSGCPPEAPAKGRRAAAVLLGYMGFCGTVFVVNMVVQFLCPT